MMVNLILSLFLIILKQEFAESIYCFDCNAHWESCAEPPNYSQIQKNRVVCAGSCVIYYNQNDGNTLYRACSDKLEAIEKRGGQTGVFTGSDNNLYYLCNTNDCNGGKSPVPQPPTFIPASLTSYAVVTSSANACYDNAECFSFNLTPQECASQFTQNSCPKTCSPQCLGLSSRTTSTATTNSPCYDNAECSSFNLTPQDCASQFTQNSCPKSCSSQCLKPADCSALYCGYGSAQVDKDGSCVCVCNDKYFGPNCDNLNITALSSSSDPIECNFLACVDDIGDWVEDVVDLCPITCKVCGGATRCRNDGTVDYATCQCNCLPNFSGDICETYNPDVSSSSDPSECTFLACVDDIGDWVEDVVDLCPNTCKGLWRGNVL